MQDADVWLAFALGGWLVPALFFMVLSFDGHIRTGLLNWSSALHICIECALWPFGFKIDV